MARKYYATPTQYAGRYTISQLHYWRVLFLDSKVSCQSGQNQFAAAKMCRNRQCYNRERK